MSKDARQSAPARDNGPAPTAQQEPDTVLAAIQRADGEELRIAWSTYNGHPFVSIRLWSRDRNGKWWPDPKRGVSIRLSELYQARTAIDEAVRLADRHYTERQNQRDQPRPRIDRPRHAQPQRPHAASKAPHQRRSWKDGILPRAEPVPANVPFNEFEDLPGD